MNLILPPQNHNNDFAGAVAVMTAADAAKFPIIARHWPVRIVGSPVAGDLDGREVCHAA